MQNLTHEWLIAVGQVQSSHPKGEMGPKSMEEGKIMDLFAEVSYLKGSLKQAKHEADKVKNGKKIKRKKMRK